MQLDKFIAKNKKVQFFCSTVYYGQAELQREGGTTCTLRYGTVHYVVSHCTRTKFLITVTQSQYSLPGSLLAHPLSLLI